MVMTDQRQPFDDPIENADAGSTLEGFASVQASLEAPLRRFIRRTLSQRADELTIDDVVQDTLIALYKRLSTGDARVTMANVRPYAFGIARNLCYEMARRASRQVIPLEDDRESFDDGWTGIVVADNAPAPEDAAYWLMLNLEVQAAIDRLPAVHRQVLTLYSEDEMSYDEIAVIMETSIGTVKSRLHYAKKMLRGMLSAATLQAIEDR